MSNKQVRTIKTVTQKVHAWTGYRLGGIAPVSFCGQAIPNYAAIDVDEPVTCRRCLAVQATVATREAARSK